MSFKLDISSLHLRLGVVRDGDLLRSVVSSGLVLSVSDVSTSTLLLLVISSGIAELILLLVAT